MTDVYQFTIAGRIGVDCMYSDISAHLRAARLAGQDIHAVIDSSGGDAPDAIAIYSAIRGYPHGTNCTIVKAASAGAIVACGFAERSMASNGWVLVHSCTQVASGNAGEIRATAERMARLDDDLASVVAESSGMVLDAARALVAGESWLTALQALDCGLVHEVVDPADPAPEGPAEPSPEEDRNHARRQAIVRAAVERDLPTRIANSEAYTAAVPIAPSLMVEPLARPEIVEDHHIADFAEVVRRNREIIVREAASQRTLSPLTPYRPGAATWSCTACGAMNTHHAGAGLEPTPCLACRSTGTNTIED